jgi:hypothetical protein
MNCGPASLLPTASLGGSRYGIGLCEPMLRDEPSAGTAIPVHKYNASGDVLWERRFGSSQKTELAELPSLRSDIYLRKHDRNSSRTGSNWYEDAFLKAHICYASILSSTWEALQMVPAILHTPRPLRLGPSRPSLVQLSTMPWFSPLIWRGRQLLTSLGGTNVTVNEFRLRSITPPGQLGVQIPYELAGQASATVLVKLGTN